MISYAKKVLTMSNTSSTADRSSKRKRNNNVESGQRRSLRCVPGDSVTSSSKRTDVDTLGSCLSDKDEYFTRKEDKKTLQVTFTCNTTNETFDSLAEAGEHFLKNEQYVFQWMEEGLAGDEMVEEALISLARGGNKDAIRICEGNDIDIEEEEEEGVGMPVKSTKKEDDEIVELLSSGEEEEEEDDDATASSTKGEVEGKGEVENTVVNANAGAGTGGAGAGGGGVAGSCKVRTYYIYIYIIYIYTSYCHLTQRVLCILLFYTQGVGCSW